MRLQHPHKGKLQQGSIFNCARVSGYENCPCFGLILNARCDLEHSKSRVIHYLPIVRFSDWIKRDMCYLLARKLRKSLDSSLRKGIAAKKVSAAVLETFDLEEIIRLKTTGQDQKTLLQKLQHLKLVDDTLSLNGDFTDRSSDLIRIEERKCDDLIEELLHAKLSGFYFLESVDVCDPPGTGYVVLLRNIASLAYEHAQQIAEGIDWQALPASSFLRSILDFHSAPICMITGVLRSPDIEHLAQCFASLFVRIGLDDISQLTLENHQAVAKG